jgi:hypothetical protein
MEIFLLLMTLAFSVFVGKLSLGLPHLAADPGGPGLFPFAAACMTATACVLLLGQRVFREARVHKGHGSVGDWVGKACANRRQLGIVLLVLLFPLAIEWLGFVIAVFAFSFLVILVSGKSLVVSVLASLLITGSIYVAYAIILGAVLPRGTLIYQLLY